jgi:hypothetical protein
MLNLDPSEHKPRAAWSGPFGMPLSCLDWTLKAHFNEAVAHALRCCSAMLQELHTELQETPAL